MQVNLDRFAQGPEDTVGMDPEPYAVCENCDCGQEIYPGERYFEAFTGEIFCSEQCVVAVVATEKEAV